MIRRPQPNPPHAAGPTARRRFAAARWPALLTVVLFLTPLPGCQTAPGGADSGGPLSEVKSLSADENVEALRSRLTSYADRYLARMGEVGDELINKTDALETRLELQEARYLTSFAVVEMAGGANPAASLLDLMVMTRLQERVWSRDPVVEMLGPDQAEKVRDMLGELSADIWRTGEDYLTQAQMNDVRRLIDQWIENNPDRERVYAVRFDDFSQLRGGEAIRADLQGSGLFGAIDEAANTADTATKLAARAKFVAERMPLLLSWQVEMLAADLMAMPEVQGALSGFTQATQAIGGITAAVESMPAEIAQQTDRILQLLVEARQTMNQADAMADSAGGAAERFEQAAQAITRANESIRGFYQTINEQSADSSGSDSEFDVTQWAAAAEQITQAADRIDEVIGSTRSLLNSDAVDTTLKDVTGAADQRINHLNQTGHGLIRSAFWYGLLLVAIGCVGGLLAALGYRLLAERVFDRP